MAPQMARSCELLHPSGGELWRANPACIGCFSGPQWRAINDEAMKIVVFFSIAHVVFLT